MAIFLFFATSCNNENADSNQANENTTDEVKQNATDESVQTNNQQTGNAVVKPYDIESGKIEYLSESMGMKSTITTFFKAYGKMQASETLTEAYGMKQLTHSVKRDGYAYVINHDNKTVNKMSLADELGNTVEDNFDFDKLTPEQKTAINLNELAKETVAGKECRVFEASQEGADLKYWIWKKILLKMQITQGGANIQMTAQNVDETWNVDDSKFNVPSDYKVIDLDQEMDFDAITQ